MKRILYSAAFMLALLATACGDANQKPSALPLIDMNADYPEKEICLQDVADVSYIPLETTDDVLLHNSLNFEDVSSKGIVCVSDNKIFLFHPDGKSRAVLNKQGQGPGEYRYAHYASVDWDREEIYVNDIHQNLMLVYSLDGTYKQQFDLEMRGRQGDMLCDDDAHIVLYKEKSGSLEVGNIVPPYRPVVLMSKEDGSIDSLSHQQDYYTTVSVEGKVGDNSLTMLLPIPALRKLNGEVYVSEVASDTIYRLADGRLEPFVARTPSVKEEDGGKYLLQLKGVTPNHYFFSVMKKEWIPESSVGSSLHIADDAINDLMYDKRTGESFHPIFSLREYKAKLFYEGLTFESCSDANTAYLKLEAFDLIEALEAGELSGELKTIAEGLKEDDNPVLMVVKFKE